VRTYQELFAVAEFRAIFTAQCLANAAAAAGSLALGTVTYAATGNAVLTGLSMFGGPLIRLAASWFTSSAADLVRPRQALTAAAAVTCAADLLQAVPGMPWGARFALLALPWIAMAATSGSMLGLVSDILPKDSYVFGRATLNIAVGGMQVIGYGLGGLLLVSLTAPGLFLLAAGAAGVAVLVVFMGVADHPPRVAGQSLVRRSREVNRALLGSPLLRPVFLAGCVHPPLPAALALGFLASAGYAASLPLQERLLAHAGAGVRGQVLGLYSTAVSAMQGIAAVLAGLLAQRLGGGPASAATAIGVFGCASLAVTVALIPGLRRTRPA
jgi:hypothetical protein